MRAAFGGSLGQAEDTRHWFGIYGGRTQHVAGISKAWHRNIEMGGNVAIAFVMRGQGGTSGRELRRSGRLLLIEFCTGKK